MGPQMYAESTLMIPTRWYMMIVQNFTSAASLTMEQQANVRILDGFSKYFYHETYICFYECFSLFHYCGLACLYSCVWYILLIKVYKCDLRSSDLTFLYVFNGRVSISTSLQYIYQDDLKINIIITFFFR